MQNLAEFQFSVFEKNQAGFSGVAQIAGQGGNYIFKSCIFLGNIAKSLSDEPFGVGSVMAIGGSSRNWVFIFNSKFLENFAFINGITKL